MIEIILCTIFGIFILFSYTLGLKNGQKLANKEAIKAIPNLELPRKYEEEEVFDKEQQQLMQVLANVEAYDGTSKGQMEVR